MSAAGAKVLAVRSLVTIRATVARQKTKSMMPYELWCTPRPSVISLPVPDGSVCIGGLPVTGTDHDRASAPEGTYGPVNFARCGYNVGISLRCPRRRQEGGTP